MSEIENKSEENAVDAAQLDSVQEGELINESDLSAANEIADSVPKEVQKRTIKTKVDYLSDLDDEHRDLLVSLKNGDISGLYDRIKDYIPERYDNYSQESLLREKLILENPSLSIGTIDKLLKSNYGIGIDEDRLSMMSEDELERYELAREVDAEKAKQLLKSKVKSLDTSKFSFEKELELDVDDMPVDDSKYKEQLEEYYKYWGDESDKELSDMNGINLEIDLGDNEQYSLKYDIEQESLDGIKKLVKEKGGYSALGELIGKRDDKGNIVLDENGLHYADPKTIFELLLLKKHKDSIFKKAISEAKTETRIKKVKEIKNIEHTKMSSNNKIENSEDKIKNYFINQLTE